MTPELDSAEFRALACAVTLRILRLLYAAA